MLVHKKEGFLYTYTEPALLAHYISYYFESDELAINSGKYAKKHAVITHDRKKNVADIIEIYNNLLRNGYNEKK